ncbi:MAG: hypothetical protein IKS11_04540, partial [Lachnospiraceae bacterium]|nr:hypothetical protein [Lachnospiraceae bacterium]
MRKITGSHNFIGRGAKRLVAGLLCLVLTASQMPETAVFAADITSDVSADVIDYNTAEFTEEVGEADTQDAGYVTEGTEEADIVTEEPGDPVEDEKTETSDEETAEITEDAPAISTYGGTESFGLPALDYLGDPAEPFEVHAVYDDGGIETVEDIGNYSEYSSAYDAAYSWWAEHIGDHADARLIITVT